MDVGNAIYLGFTQDFNAILTTGNCIPFEIKIAASSPMCPDTLSITWSLNSIIQEGSGVNILSHTNGGIGQGAILYCIIITSKENSGMAIISQLILNCQILKNVSFSQNLDSRS